MRHPILSRVPLVFLGTCFRWAVTSLLDNRIESTKKNCDN